jgi:hypothetical protein
MRIFFIPFLVIAFFTLRNFYLTLSNLGWAYIVIAISTGVMVIGALAFLAAIIFEVIERHTTKKSHTFPSRRPTTSADTTSAPLPKRVSEVPLPTGNLTGTYSGSVTPITVKIDARGETNIEEFIHNKTALRSTIRDSQSQIPESGVYLVKRGHSQPDMPRVIRGLIIDEPWMGMILRGEKSWEMRSTRTKHTGYFALIKKGSKKVYGIARLDSVEGPLDRAQLLDNCQYHRVPPEIYQAPDYKWRYAWKLTDVWQFEVPISYIHKNGAVTWVNLDDNATVGIQRARMLKCSADYAKLTVR